MSINDLLTKTAASGRKNLGFLVNIVDRDIVNRLPEKAPDRREGRFFRKLPLRQNKGVDTASIYRHAVSVASGKI